VSVAVVVALADVETRTELSLSFARMLTCVGTVVVLVEAESSVDIEESVEVAAASVDESTDVASVSESVLIGVEELNIDIIVLSVVEEASVLLADESVSVVAVVAVDEDVGSSLSLASLSPLALAGSKAATSLGPSTTETAGPAGVNTRVTLFGSAPGSLTA